MDITSLCFAGGGPSLIKLLGVIQVLEKNNFWKRENITSIFSTSSGSWLAIIVSLQIEWDIINDYILNRPWNNAINITPNQLLNIYTTKGLFDIEIIKIFFKPLFLSKNISLDINLKDFYILTKIDMFFYTFELNNFKLIELSYKTHPNLKVFEALYMTSCVPFLFKPYIISNNYDEKKNDEKKNDENNNDENNKDEKKNDENNNDEKKNDEKKNDENNNDENNKDEKKNDENNNDEKKNDEKKNDENNNDENNKDEKKNDENNNDEKKNDEKKNDEKIYNNIKCYLDGGLKSNYPLEYCLKYNKNTNNILSFKNIFINKKNIDEETNTIDFLTIFLNKFIDINKQEQGEIKIKNEIIIENTPVSFNYLFNIIYSKDLRNEMLNEGIEIGKKYITILYDK